MMKYQWRPGMVMASADPVALDRIAHELIEERRTKHGLRSLKEGKRPPKWLETAAAKGLGEAERSKIKLDQG